MAGGLPRAVASGVEIDGQGRAVIADATIEAHRIAALLDGDMDVDEVVQGYVSLTCAQVLAAKAYADAHPWTCRPFPPLTAKKAMREAKLDGVEKVLPRRRRGISSIRTSSANSPNHRRPPVVRWLGSIEEPELIISAITVRELRYGGEESTRQEPASAELFSLRIDAVIASFAGRVLAIDERVARIWAVMLARSNKPIDDTGACRNGCRARASWSSPATSHTCAAVACRCSTRSGRRQPPSRPRPDRPLRR